MTDTHGVTAGFLVLMYNYQAEFMTDIEEGA